MKKLLLVIVSAFSASAHAVVTSNITGIEVWMSGTPTYVPSQVDCATGTYNPGFLTHLALTGIGSGPGEINFLGQICLDIGGGSPYVGLDVNLRGQGWATPVGTVFNDGSIDYYVDFGSGWLYAGSVSASINPIDCTNTPTTTGFVVGNPTALPGAPTVPPTNAACDLPILGLSSLLYLY